MTKAALTVGELARAVALPGEELSAVTDRLRAWTKEGLLRPIGSKSTGTGHKRLYPWRAVFDAAILSKLASYYGLRATAIAPALDDAWKQIAKYDYFADQGQDIWLLIGVSAGAGQRAKLISAVVLVDSFERSRPTPYPEKRTIELPREMTDAVLAVNVSLIYDRFSEQMKEASDFYERFPEARRIRKV
jgi:hypothetical protein